MYMCVPARAGCVEGVPRHLLLFRLTVLSFLPILHRGRVCARVLVEVGWLDVSYIVCLWFIGGGFTSPPPDFLVRLYSLVLLVGWIQSCILVEMRGVGWASTLWLQV